MSVGSRCLLVGLKGSGKTTFLAALWHLVEASELPASLTMPKLQPNRRYLNDIRERWLRFEEVGRTPVVVHETLDLLLQDSRTGDLLELAVPDLSGESLRLQWAMRHATVKYAELAKIATGLFLFVHPTSVREMPLIRPQGVASAPSGNR